MTSPQLQILIKPCTKSEKKKKTQLTFEIVPVSQISRRPVNSAGAVFRRDNIGPKRPTLAQSQAGPSHDQAVFPTCKSPRYHGHFSKFLLHRTTAFWGLTAGADFSAIFFLRLSVFSRG